MNANLAETGEKSSAKMQAQRHSPQRHRGHREENECKEADRKKGKPGSQSIWADEALKQTASAMLRTGMNQATAARELQRTFGNSVSRGQISRLAQELAAEPGSFYVSNRRGRAGIWDRPEIRAYASTALALTQSQAETARQITKIFGVTVSPSQMYRLAKEERDERAEALLKEDIHHRGTEDTENTVDKAPDEIEVPRGDEECDALSERGTFNPYPKARQLHSPDLPGGGDIRYFRLKDKLVETLMVNPDLPETVREMLTTDPVSRCGFKGIVSQSKYSCFTRQVLSGIKRKVRGHGGAMVLNAMYLGCKGCGNFLTDVEYDWVITVLKEARRVKPREIAA
jgi:hypothetical protein